MKCAQFEGSISHRSGEDGKQQVQLYRREMGLLKLLARSSTACAIAQRRWKLVPRWSDAVQLETVCAGVGVAGGVEGKF